MSRFLIISGMSGAGKSRVAGILEDLGFYCVDNMPAVLIPRFAELCLAAKGQYERVALVTDVRGGDFDGLFDALDELRSMDCAYEIVFVECTIDVVIHRYKETRRRHPLAGDGEPVEQTAAREYKMLEPIRSRAHYIINTTTYTLGQLKSRVTELFAQDEEASPIVVNTISFGYKYGLPPEADLVFDARFLPNPYYQEELREKTGLDYEVRDFVFSYPLTADFFDRLKSLIAFLMPNFIEEGRTSVVIAIGCTGGRHRSVALACALDEYVATLGCRASLNHRDIGR